VIVNIQRHYFPRPNIVFRVFLLRECNLPLAPRLHLQMVWARAKKTTEINKSIRGKSRRDFSSFRIARSSRRDRELKSTRENRFVWTQRRERNDEAKCTVWTPYHPPSIPSSRFYNSTRQDDATVVKLRLIRFYVRFDSTFHVAHSFVRKFSKYFCWSKPTRMFCVKHCHRIAIHVM